MHWSFTLISYWCVSTGATNGAMDAGNLLKPMLGRGELRCIGATTLDEYRKYIEKDPALERRFQQVYVDQPSVENTISILRGLRERYELHHGVRISDSALVEAAILSDRYISGRFLPDKGKYHCDEWNSSMWLKIDMLYCDEKVLAGGFWNMHIMMVANGNFFEIQPLTSLMKLLLS